MSEESIRAENRDDFRVTQKAIIFEPKEKKFLLAKAIDHGGSFVKSLGPWDFFGGHIEAADADMLATLDREITEEAGDMKYEVLGIIDAIRFDYGKYERVCIGHLAFYHGGEIVLSDEHSEYRWETAEEVAQSEEYKPWLKEFVAKAVKRIEQLDALDGWKRCMADFDNFKRRQAESQKDFAQYAAENVLTQILPVLDNFHAATAHIPADQQDNPWVTGIMYIQQQLEKVLEENDVTEIAVKVGDAFDPVTMEALKDTNTTNGDTNATNGDTNSKAAEGGAQKVVKVVQKGYTMKEKVLRVARVVVE